MYDVSSAFVRFNFLAVHVAWLHRSEGRGSTGVTTSHLTISVTSCVIMPVCVCE